MLHYSLIGVYILQVVAALGHACGAIYDNSPARRTFFLCALLPDAFVLDILWLALHKI